MLAAAPVGRPLVNSSAIARLETIVFQIETAGIFAHSMSEDRLAAQVDMPTAMMTPSNAVN
jgi:hypothetical protein